VSNVGKNSAASDPASLADLIADKAVVDCLREASPTSFDAASGFWRVPLEGPNLTPRMKELILLAMHAAATSLNVEAMERHVMRARRAGATPGDIVDVLLTIVGLANHALYFSVPILEEEMTAAGRADELGAPPGETFEEAKRLFVEARGFWNSDREALARLMPDYFQALTRISTDSWQNGPLTLKEREFICIGIDCTVTHNYEPGLRVHIRKALQQGASRDEILEIFELAALLGLEGYVIAGRALARESPDT
jgi:alkylhydroperoxidase/carboxymuconolactone decarboxylase family protein YurZ